VGDSSRKEGEKIWETRKDQNFMLAVRHIQRTPNHGVMQIKRRVCVASKGKNERGRRNAHHLEALSFCAWQLC